MHLLYKAFARRLLASSLDDREHAYDAQQTEEHQSFRAGRRLGKHLLTANILFDRTVIPMVDYPHPLVDVWLATLACILDSRPRARSSWTFRVDVRGDVLGTTCWWRSDKFSIAGGVQQACVLSPWSFGAALECGHDLPAYVTNLGNCSLHWWCSSCQIPPLSKGVTKMFADDDLLDKNLVLQHCAVNLVRDKRNVVF